jgi:hypothetical protein
LCRDNTPSVLLCEWEVESDYLEDDRITGVMPVLFANDPKAAEAGMMDNLATARKDLDKINRAFFVPESLDIEEAAKVAKKPRLGDAEFLYKDWNLERLFETSVPTSAYTGEVFIEVQISGIFINNVHTPENKSKYSGGCNQARAGGVAASGSANGKIIYLFQLN